MNLHPVEAVLAALDVNHRGFAVVHHYLDVAVQEAAAQWEDRYPDLTRLHGAVLASSVRGRIDALAQGGELRSTPLALVTVSNCGLHLYGSDGVRYRILERPLSSVSPGRLLPVSDPQIDTLFGTVPSATAYELAVLWSIDYKSKSLGKVVLAAVADIDIPTRAAIYAEVALPDPLTITLSAVPSTDSATDPENCTIPVGFDDLFGEEDEGSGESS